MEPQMMTAARYHARGDLRVETITAPVPGPEEVLIRVAYSGICGTDLNEFYDGPVFMPAEPHPLTGHQLPAVPGHEFAGVVERFSSRVPKSAAAAGSLVTVFPLISCGECQHCTDDNPQRCDQIAITGNAGGHGGFAQYATVHWTQAMVVPRGVRPDQAALVEPLAVAEHGISRLDTLRDCTALIIGAGPVGIAAALALRHSGAAAVAVTDPAAARLDTVAALGFAPYDPTANDNQQFDIVIDCAGAPNTPKIALEHVVAGGKVLMIAMSVQPLPVPFNLLNVKEATIIGTHLYAQTDFVSVLNRFAAGAIDTTGWVDVIDLENLVDGYGTLKTGRAVKILVDPTRSSS